MGNRRPFPFRAFLLASAACVTFTCGGLAQTGPGPVITLGDGQSLSNGGVITATSSQAVLVDGGATSIGNTGLIQATGAGGIGVQVPGAGSLASMTNGGTIQATDSGNAILVGDTAGGSGSLGTLSNSGLIQLTGSGAAVGIGSASSVAAIVNSGTIAQGGGGAAQDAINVAGSAGVISNSGLIQGGSDGVAIRIEGTVGSILNGPGGTITSAPGGAGNAIYLTGSSENPPSVGTINNSGLGGQNDGSGIAIDNSTNPNTLAITNAATIIGAVKLGPAGDTLTVTGGTIAGAIIGLAGSHDVVTFSPLGTFTTDGSIADVDSINVTREESAT